MAERMDVASDHANKAGYFVDLAAKSEKDAARHNGIADLQRNIGVAKDKEARDHIARASRFDAQVSRCKSKAEELRLIGDHDVIPRVWQQASYSCSLAVDQYRLALRSFQEAETAYRMAKFDFDTALYHYRRAARARNNSSKEYTAAIWSANDNDERTLLRLKAASNQEIEKNDEERWKEIQLCAEKVSFEADCACLAGRHVEELAKTDRTNVT
jgi:TPR repeat protein